MEAFGLFDLELDPFRENDDMSAKFAALFFIYWEWEERAAALLLFGLEQLGERDALL